MAGYWPRSTSNRCSRRRALSGAAAVGMGAAAVGTVGCGGGDSGGADSGLLSKPVDTTSKMKPGYAIPESWQSTLVFTIQWPVIGNLGVVRTANGGNPIVEYVAPSWWIDDSQPPLGKS